MKSILSAAMLAGALLAGDALAGAFTIAPIRVELSSRAPMVAVTVRNTDAGAAASIQTETMVWRQEGGEDVYEATRALVVSPPIFTLAPGAEQVVRIALRGQADAVRETLYRVYFRELPAAVEDAASAGRTPTVRMVLRMGIPVVVAPVSGKPTAKPVVRVEATKEGGQRVVMQNDGTGHLRVTNLVVTDTKTGGEVAKSGSFYVLPSSWWASREFPIAADNPGGTLHVTASTDAGDIDTTLQQAAR